MSDEATSESVAVAENVGVVEEAAPASPSAESRMSRKQMVARIEELEATLAFRDDQIAVLQRMIRSPSADDAAGEFRSRIVLAGIRFRGRDYYHGDTFPFDPNSPPSDVSGVFVEGIHYGYR